MHISVLLEESINGLNLKSDGIYVDCTLGYAGHSSRILERIKRGYLFAIDQDQDAIDYSKNKLNEIGENFTIIKSNFSNLKVELQKRNIDYVDGFLFDLGVSSVQLDNADRGFAYITDVGMTGPKDSVIGMNKEASLSAYNVVNEYSKNDLIKIFFEYGEEKYSKIIASNIVKYREKKKIQTTLELVQIISDSLPMKAKRDKHPARKVFQAIRIEVNHELDILEDSIKDALSMLNIGGRIAIITFHSLEDRIVKNVFKKYTEVDKKIKGLPNIPDNYLPDFKLVNKKPIEPSEDELKKNNRSRSAKLRIIERIK